MTQGGMDNRLLGTTPLLLGMEKSSENLKWCLGIHAYAGAGDLHLKGTHPCTLNFDVSVRIT